MLMRLFSFFDKHSLQKICSQHLVQVNLVVDLHNIDHLMKSAKTDYKLIKLASVKNICLVELLAHKL